MRSRRSRVTYLGVQPPPLPVSQLEVSRTVSLNNSDGIELLKSFLVVSSGKVTAAEGLKIIAVINETIIEKSKKLRNIRFR